MVVEGPRRPTTHHVGIEGGIGDAAPQAKAEARPDVAHPVEFGPDPTRLYRAPDLGGAVAVEPREHRLGRDHAGFHRGMTALDLRHIQKAGRIADQRTTWKIEPRHRLETALADRAGAIGDASAALEITPNRRMGLEALELLERVQKRVPVVERDDEADRDLVVFEVV